MPRPPARTDRCACCPHAHVGACYARASFVRWSAFAHVHALGGPRSRTPRGLGGRAGAADLTDTAAHQAWTAGWPRRHVTRPRVGRKTVFHGRAWWRAGRLWWRRWIGSGGPTLGGVPASNLSAHPKWIRRCRAAKRHGMALRPTRICSPPERPWADSEDAWRDLERAAGGWHATDAPHMGWSGGRQARSPAPRCSPPPASCARPLNGTWPEHSPPRRPCPRVGSSRSPGAPGLDVALRLGGRRKTRCEPGRLRDGGSGPPGGGS